MLLVRGSYRVSVSCEAASTVCFVIIGEVACDNVNCSSVHTVALVKDLVEIG